MEAVQPQLNSSVEHLGNSEGFVVGLIEQPESKGSPHRRSPQSWHVTSIASRGAASLLPHSRCVGPTTTVGHGSMKPGSTERTGM